MKINFFLSRDKRRFTFDIFWSIGIFELSINLNHQESFQMRISDRLTRIKPSATLAVNAKAMELRAQGRDIISLAVGQPDFGTPRHVCEAAKADRKSVV